MNAAGRRIWFLLLVSVLVSVGWAYQHAQEQRVAVLKSISALEVQLASYNQQSARANAQTVRMISRYACLNFNQARDQALLRRSQQVLARTQTLVDTIHLIRQQLRAVSGWVELAKSLPPQLNRYQALIEQVVPDMAPLTRPSKEAEAGWFGQFDLNTLPVTAARASLTQLEAQLRRYEALALRSQAEKSGTNSMWFEIIRPLVVPEAETVAPGTPYRARVFLALLGQNDYCNMQMTANGVALTTPSKQGDAGMQVKFAVPPLQLGQPDTLRAYWHGSIRAQSYPDDTIFQIDVPYFIVKSPAQ